MYVHKYVRATLLKVHLWFYFHCSIYIFDFIILMSTSNKITYMIRLYIYGKDCKNIVQNIFDYRCADFTVHHMQVELRTDYGTS